MRRPPTLGMIAVVASLASCEREPIDESRLPTNSQALPAPDTVDALQGQALYVQHCLLCHQQDGGGVPNMQPSLLNNDLVAGDPRTLIEIVLKGIGGQPPALLSSGGYGVIMPGMANLSDREIADLLTYIRQAFSPSEPITPEQVAAIRAGGG